MIGFGFFVERQTVKLAHQRHSLTELKEMLSVEVEAPMFSSLEQGWWLHLGLNPISIETLEQLNMDASAANNLLPTEAETFTQFTSHQLESKYLLCKRCDKKAKIDSLTENRAVTDVSPRKEMEDFLFPRTKCFIAMCTVKVYFHNFTANCRNKSVLLHKFMFSINVQMKTRLF